MILVVKKRMIMVNEIFSMVAAFKTAEQISDVEMRNGLPFDKKPPAFWKNPLNPGGLEHNPYLLAKAFLMRLREVSVTPR